MTSQLEFKGLTKRYGSVTVLDDVTISLKPGRVHALMGENGAGKSTVIKMIAGVVAANKMQVIRDGQEIALNSMSDADRAGFRFIHQELNVVPSLSVAENILLGQKLPSRFGAFVDWKEMARRSEQALATLGVDHIDVKRHAGALGSGDQMLIMLASALVSNPGEADPSLYVLDEPTAALKEAEVEKLFAVIRRLRDKGAAILYVSHRLGEIMSLCDDVTVLRNGRHISTLPLEETSRERVVADMTGKSASDSFPPRRSDLSADIGCKLDGLSSRHLTGIDFELRRGEILGIAGLSGAGQSELLNLFLGLERPLIGSGRLNDAPLPRSPAKAWEAGVAYVPGERRAQGLMMPMGVRSNILLPHLAGLFARLGREKKAAGQWGRKVNLKADGLEQPVWQLSGGNQQKVVFARALAGKPDLLLLDDPTRGVDVGARFEIYAIIRELSEGGTAVLVASSDLPELLGICDRILIMHKGRQANLINPEGMRPGDLLQAIYAAQVEDPASEDTQDKVSA